MLGYRGADIENEI